MHYYAEPQVLFECCEQLAQSMPEARNVTPPQLATHIASRSSCRENMADSDSDRLVSEAVRSANLQYLFVDESATTIPYTTT